MLVNKWLDKIYKKVKIECEICHEHIATKSKVSLSGKKLRVCEKRQSISN